MKKPIFYLGNVAFLLIAFAASASEFSEAFQKRLDWKFSEEEMQLFAPPLDATIEQMRTWANRLERPIPEDTEKWGGFEKYRDRVAQLKIDIARQIIASKPEDDLVTSLAWGDQWFPHCILAYQDKAKIPQFENFYAELKQQNDEWGRKLDRFTSSLMSTRGAVVRDLLEFDKKEEYIALGEELLAEYDALLEGKPLGEFTEEFYGRKYRLLNDLGEHDEKFRPVAAAYAGEMREVVKTRKDEIETASLFFYFGPNALFDTPEGQAVQREWMEWIAGQIPATENAEKRYGLYRIKGNVLYNLSQVDAVTDEEWLLHIKELEAQTGKDIYHSSYLNDIYNGYFRLFARELNRLLKSDTITDDALEQLFASAKQVLYGGESAYGHNGRAFVFFVQGGDELYSRLTPQQQTFYIKAFEELMQETEKVEKEWIAAGKPMDSVSELPRLRGHLARLQLSGTNISFIGTKLGGEPFDLASLRGKIVLLNFWATWCGPCVAELPDLLKRYEEFHARGFEIVAISINEEADKEQLTEFVQSRQLPWIQLHDPKDELFNKLHGRGVPYNLLLDRDGKVILSHARSEALRQKLNEMIPPSDH